jgi:hypothetical protein
MNSSLKIQCCICGGVVHESDSDGHSLQVRKFGTKTPGVIWALGKCLREVIPVVAVELSPRAD